MKQINTIPGYKDVQDYYHVTKEGNVFSLSGQLSPGDVNGYKYVNLRTQDGKSKVVLVHRLVASAFIPNPEN